MACNGAMRLLSIATVLYCIVLYGTASEDAYESGLRSIGGMVVEIWPK